MGSIKNKTSQETLGNNNTVVDGNSFVSSNEDTEIEEGIAIDITSKSVNELKQQKETAIEIVEKDEIAQMKKNVLDENDERYVSVELSRGKLVAITFALCIVTLLACLDMTIVATALPTIAAEFGDISGYSWVITSYMLSSTAAQPIYGKLVDIFGRRSIMMVSIAIFAVTSLVCGMSNGMNMLIVFRGLQGIGGGGLMSISMIIIADVIPIRQRGQYMGILGAVFSFSTVIGPLVGGVFTDELSWRWAFYINIPLAVIALVIIFFFVRIPTPKGNLKEKLLRIDYLGTVVMVCTVICLLLALEWGGVEYDWDSYQIIILFVLFAIFLVGFIIVEVKFAKEPIVPPQIFKIRNIVCMLCGVVLIGFAFMGTSTYLPLYFQMVRGLKASVSGLRMTPMSVVVTVFSIASGFFIGKFGRVKYLLFVGFILAASAGYFYSCLGMDSGLWKQLLIIGYGGLGIGLVRQNLVLVAQDSSPKSLLASTTAIMSFFQVIGGIVGIAIFNTILNNRVPKKVHEYDPSIAVEDVDMKLINSYGEAGLKGYNEGLRMNFLVIIPCCILALIIVMCSKNVRLNEKPKKHNKNEKDEQISEMKSVDTINDNNQESGNYYDKPLDGSTVVDMNDEEDSKKK